VLTRQELKIVSYNSYITLNIILNIPGFELDITCLTDFDFTELRLGISWFLRLSFLGDKNLEIVIYAYDSTPLVAKVTLKKWKSFDVEAF